MQFTLYTEKPLPQCLTALNERLSGASKFEGTVNRTTKRFTLSTTTRVFNRFERQTRLRGHLETGDGFTLISGSVPSGVPRERMIWVIVFIIVSAVLMFLVQRNIIASGLILLAGGYICVLLAGDAANSDTLIRETKRVLSARETPPKKGDNLPKGSKSTATAAGGRPSALGAARTSTPPR